MELLGILPTMVDRRKSITTKCYGEIIKWDDRKQAKDFFLEAMMNSDDTEHEHYSAVYIQLVNGLSYCTDCEKD